MCLCTPHTCTSPRCFCTNVPLHAYNTRVHSSRCVCTDVHPHGRHTYLRTPRCTCINISYTHVTHINAHIGMPRQMRAYACSVSEGVDPCVCTYACAYACCVRVETSVHVHSDTGLYALHACRRTSVHAHPVCLCARWVRVDEHLYMRI